jgi:hypothetical protein
VAVYVVGHLSWGFAGFAEHVPTATARLLVSALYYTLPDLETFNVRSQVVYERPIGTGYMLDALGYAVTYTVGMLTLAVLLFRRRDLT